MASQGANNGAGQAAGQRFVQFSKGAASRIAKVVRTVEAGDRSQPGVTFDHPMPGAALTLKVGTFTGTWAKGAWKTVTIVGGTNTASVYNWCNAYSGDTSATQHVVFGKASGTNSVLEISLESTSQTCRTSIAGVDLTAFPGYVAGTIQLLGHSAASTTGTACSTLTWYSITTCATA